MRDISQSTFGIVILLGVVLLFISAILWLDDRVEGHGQRIEELEHQLQTRNNE
jgi:hypothetical protein